MPSWRMPKLSGLSSGWMSSSTLRQLAMFKPEPNCSLLHWALIALRSAEGLEDTAVALNRSMIPVPVPLLDP